MGRKRRSRLLPALHMLVEEFARELSARVAEVVADSSRKYDSTLGEMRGELRRLERRLERSQATRLGRTSRNVRRCKVDGCYQPHVAKGFCKNHYQQTRYREMKVAEARAAGKRYSVPRPGQKRPGRKPKIPLPT
jgi:hypothetical protein